MDSYIAEHIAYAEPLIRPVLEAVRHHTKQLGKEVIESATPAQRITYSWGRIFLEVKVQKRRVLLRFFDSGIPDPLKMVNHIDHAEKNGWQHDKEIRLEKLEDVDYAMRFVEASFSTISGIQQSHRPTVHGSQQASVVSKMVSISIPAARVRQGGLTLYSTALKVSDLIRQGFYAVETLDPEDDDDKGYQRILNKARAKKLADYVVKGQDAEDAFLPTSVFLATDQNVEFDPDKNVISFSINEVGPFNVVDGQHRLEGLKLAAEKDKRVLDFEVPVNIAVNLPSIHQMCHFLIVNTTQKSVDKSVEQRIVKRLTEALEVEDMPSLPRWILSTVEKGEVERAVRYVDYLNDHKDSPWFGKIKKANDSSGSGKINQSSFVKSIVKYVLTANNPISAVRDFDREKKIFLNYWVSIANIIDDGDTETLYKYGSVELFCQFSVPFFMKLQSTGNYTVNRMEELLNSCFENIDGEYAGVGHPEWWRTGGQAGQLNAGALRRVAHEMARALNKSSMPDAIQI